MLFIVIEMIERGEITRGEHVIGTRTVINTRIGINTRSQSIS